MIRKKLLLLSVIFSLCISAYCQNARKPHNRTLLIASDTIHLDTLSIVPGSVFIKNNDSLLHPSLYEINYAEGLIIFKKPVANVNISYTTFPVLFSKELKHKNTNTIYPDLSTNYNGFNYSTGNTSNDVLKTEGLDKSGSISRGITFGNTQNLVVNSNLNLQLSGKLSNDIEILLAATDSNIPIQPDGNTQQLQEFDKVFIQLSKDNTKLIAGDFQLLRPNSYFMNFYKKAQGISFSTTTSSAKNKFSYTTSASAAVSRGKFARNIIQGIESNQGPYRLYGAENETYIIVLSGTERVYIDGRLLTRGQEHDYIIDYNTAQITFTAKQLITKDKRIIVEFQYSDKNYARSLLFVGNEFKTSKSKIYLNIYSEQDSKNQPLKQNLSDVQKKKLSQIGDTLANAIVPGYDAVPFSADEVLYKQMDTTINTTPYTIFKYSTNADSARYRVTFSNVGQGNGNYIQVVSGANGKVYQWVSPDSITHQKKGMYEPIIQLITPKQKQMITAGINHAINSNTKLFLEGVLTNNDINTFSSIDKNDDIGYGLKMALDNALPVKKDTTHNNLLLLTNINYEYVQKNFAPVERYRSVEFERDWNRKNAQINNDQHIIGAGWKLEKKQVGSIGYKMNGFYETNNYAGLKHYGNILLNKNGFHISYDGSLLHSSSTQNTNFYRHLSDISKTTKGVTIGFKDYFEQNKFTQNNKDSLLANSYRFWEWQGYAQNADTTKNRYGVFYKERTDYATQLFVLSKSTLGKSYGAFLDLNQNPRSQLKINTAYRTLQIINTGITSQKPDNTLVSRIEYTLRLWKGFILSNSFYEIGSGLEVKKEFLYIEVAPGQGIYTWIDYNNNGVKELNEFEIATYPSTATYLRVYTPTSDYVKTFNNQFSQQVMIKPATLWAGKQGFKKALARFANQTVYRVDRKTNDNNYLNAYNPFLPESQLLNNILTLNSSLRNTFFINQLSPVFGLDLTYQNIKNISLLVNGLDSRQHLFKEARLRWNVTRLFNWNILLKNGSKQYNSQYFDTRNYHFMYTEVEPKFSYQPNTAFRITTMYKYSVKQNEKAYGNQKASLNDYGIEVRYNILQSGSFNAKANIIEVTYNAAQNTSIAFEMLESLQTGRNYTWGFSYQFNFSNYMQMSITYDGRKSPTAKTLHTGGAQIRAYF